MVRAQKIYQKKIKVYEILYKKKLKIFNTISNLRLLIAVIGVLTTVYLYPRLDTNKLYIVVLAFLIIFGYIVLRHNRVGKEMGHISSIKAINQQYLDRAQGNWKSFKDAGEDFKDQKHRFSYDLDIFGKGSLFQWISICGTYLGRLHLKNLLTQPCEDKENLYKRQEAVAELSDKLWWRQRFQQETGIADKSNNEEELLQWAINKNIIYTKKAVVMAVRLLPIITIVLIALSYVKLVPFFIPIVMLVLHTLLLFLGIKRRGSELEEIYKCKNNIKSYVRMLAQIEKTFFKTPYLRELKNKLRTEQGQGALEQVRRLERLVDRVLNRNNLMFFPINIITLWDYQCMVDIEKWRKESGHLIQGWLEVIGEMEALSSLAIIGYDYPDWAVPKLLDQPSTLISVTMGHPLLSGGRVCNDLLIDNRGPILLITGSNMSGKSTLLRTVGINLVLAYSGAKVCAKSFECSVMDIYTSMRTSDDLNESISSFYAELLRIKEIIKASEGNSQVFFLLDEIFKGTNSQDRHIGAKALIKQLFSKGSVGLVSTHDLELGELEKDDRVIVKNYHFQEYYKDDKICFDYKLRQGVSTTRNAMYLIKMAGIEV